MVYGLIKVIKALHISVIKFYNSPVFKKYLVIPFSPELPYERGSPSYYNIPAGLKYVDVRRVKMCV